MALARRFIWILGLLAGRLAAQAQAPLVGADSPAGLQAPHWSWGVRLGLGFSQATYGSLREQYSPTYLSPTAGLVFSRYAPRPRLNVQAELLYTARRVATDYRTQPNGQAIYAPIAATSHHLFVPLYLRTGTPANWLHLVAGGGPAFHLSTPAMPVDALYRPHRADGAVLLGLDLRLARVRQTETTLGLHTRIPFTAAYEYGAPGGHRNQSFAPWLGLSFATVFHPSVQP